MTVPELVRERLGDASVRARVPLQGEDELVVADDRTLLYRAEGLLSGESIEEVPHDAESVSVSEGRRKTTVRLDHGIDGESEFTVPNDSIEEVLTPLLGGVLSAEDVTAPDESVEAVHRLGELTVVVAEGRVIKHVGSAVWDREFEEYAFEEVTGLDIEEGDVSSQIIVEVEGRPQRIKAPSDDAREIRQRIERALFAYYDVDSYGAFEAAVRGDEPESEETDSDDGTGPDGEPDASEESGTASTPDANAGDTNAAERPASATGSRSATGSDASEEAETDADAGADAAEGDDFEFEDVDVEGAEETVAEELSALREAVERQNELLETQQRALEVLIEELRD